LELEPEPSIRFFVLEPELEFLKKRRLEPGGLPAVNQLFFIEQWEKRERLCILRDEGRANQKLVEKLKIQENGLTLISC